MEEKSGFAKRPYGVLILCAVILDGIFILMNRNVITPIGIIFHVAFCLIIFSLFLPQKEKLFLGIPVIIAGGIMIALNMGMVGQHIGAFFQFIYWTLAVVTGIIILTGKPVYVLAMIAACVTVSLTSILIAASGGITSMTFYSVISSAPIILYFIGIFIRDIMRKKQQQ